MTTAALDFETRFKMAMRPLHKASLTEKDIARIRRCVKDAIVIEKRAGIFYQTGIATRAPEGMILVHNHVQRSARTRSGTNGFRFWNAAPKPNYVVCQCGWRSDLGTHYRVEGKGAPR
jgi:hypothetical protein